MKELLAWFLPPAQASHGGGVSVRLATHRCAIIAHDLRI